MAERLRSKDGVRETEEVLGEKGDPGLAGRAGGDLAKRVGTKDEKKRAFERPAGATRVTKEDEIDEGKED